MSGLPKHKVFAYITHGGRLLVFRHPDVPAAGIQVPAGTLEPGEDPAAGVLREAYEETWLSGLQLDCFLGLQIWDMTAYGRAEIHHRHFYHLRCPGRPPAAWRHWETTPSDGSPAPIAFDFFWAPVPAGVPRLIAGHDGLVPELIRVLGL